MKRAGRGRSTTENRLLRKAAANTFPAGASGSESQAPLTRYIDEVPG